MSKSLYIDCQRIDEPAAVDPVERQTWAAFRLDVEGVSVTDFWDHRTASISKTIYMPVFAVADWIVRNWWVLLYEPCRGEAPPAENMRWDQDDREWLTRHCLRTAESSLFLPFVHIFSNGPAVSIVWSSDERGAPTNMPGYFVDSGAARLDRRDVETALREFVAEVLRWCDGVKDIRIEQMRSDLAAIVTADPEEQSFCQAAGRMGLDPYAIDKWPDGIAQFITTTVGDRIHEGVVCDFFEAAEAASAPELWAWIDRTQQRCGLSGRPPAVDARTSRFRTAKDQGYDLAQLLRRQTGLSEREPLLDLALFTQNLGGLSLKQRGENHLPSRNVSAVVGWSDPDTAVVAGPILPRIDNTRFLLSRGLYQALVGCKEGVRLLTRASTWDQQVSRAFAAELLAPREALASHARADMDIEERDSLQRRLAREYHVSTEVIRLQLHNQGIWR